MKCRHGHEAGGPAAKGWTIGGSLERKVARHEEKCRNPRIFWHEGFIFRSICCSGCGKTIY